MKTLTHGLWVCILCLSATLTIHAQGIESEDGIKIGNSTSTTDGTIRYTGTDVEARVSGVWESLTGGGTNIWTQNGSDVYYDGGDVGIGVTNPSNALDVFDPGFVTLTLTAGNSTSNALYFFRNSSGLTADRTFLSQQSSQFRFGNNIPGNNFDWWLTPTTGSGRSVMTLDADSGELGIGTDDPESTLHVEGGDIRVTGADPDIFISSDGTADPALAFGDNGGLADGRIWYDSSEDQLEIGTNTTFGDIVIAGDGKVGIDETNDLESQLTIKANSGTVSTPAQLELRENNNADFARLRYTQFSVSGYWDLAGIAEPDGSATGNPRFNFYYGTGSSGTNIMTIDGDDQRVGINDTSPTAGLSVKQQSGDDGISIENDGDTDVWSFNIGTNDLFLKFDGTNVGQFDDASGSYSAISDRRFKNNINPLSDGYLEKLNQVEISSYFYNHAKDQKVPSYGFIAQDLKEIFPEVVNTTEEGESHYLVNYDKMSVITTKAVQELSQQVQDLTQIIDQLKSEIEELKSSK